MVTRPRLMLALPFLVAFLCGCGSKGAAEGGEKEGEGAPVLVELTPVQKKTVETTVTAQGVFAAAQGSSVKVGAISAGRIQNVFVKEGDQVQAGQLVALLENKAQSAQNESAAAALSVAASQAKESVITAEAAKHDQQSAVKIATLGFETAKEERQSALKQAAFDVQAAELDLHKAMTGGRPQEIAQADQAVHQAQVAKDTAERDERRNAFLLQKGIVSQKTYDDSKAALANAVASLNSALANASLVHEGPRPEDKRTAQLKFDLAKQAQRSTTRIQDQKVLQAETTLNQALQAELQVQAKSQEAQAALRTVKQKAADANAAKAALAQLEVKSPITGRVVRRFLNPGDTPDNNAPILEIVSPKGGLDLVANIPAASGSALKAGQKATITISAQTPTEVEGAVVSIGQVDVQSGLLSFRIRANAPPSWVQPGTFGSASIVISEHKNALVVPKQAVLTRDGATIVFIAKDEKAVLVKVEVGSEQDGQVEILKGLSGGESVITLGNYELADKGAIKTSEADDKKDDKKDAGDAKDAKADDKKDDKADAKDAKADDKKDGKEEKSGAKDEKKDEPAGAEAK